jgi:outer membrane protein assembly factor BamA
MFAIPRETMAHTTSTTMMQIFRKACARSENGSATATPKNNYRHPVFEMINLPRVPLLFAIVVAIASVTISFGQAPRKIARIDTEGLQAVTRENVIAMTELKVGDPFTVGAVDAAAQRLIDSGLFKNVGYRTRTTGAAVTITFQLEELKSNSSPLIFDNFIWFSDEELTAVVKSVLPSFTGSIPDTGKSTEMIKQALQTLIVDRKLAGTVEYTLTDTGHLFRVGGVPLNICTLHFPGSNKVPEQELIETTKSSTDLNYSRQAAMTFPKYGLFPLYREVGHLKAAFGAPVAKPDTNPGCEGGVDLTIPVNEGLAYSWAKAEWRGNQAFSPNELESALGMKVDEVAKGKKFDRGLKDVQKLYGTKGHIDAHLNAEPDFDDAAQRVTFRIDVREGPVYRMGAVEFKGFSEEDAEALKQRWRLGVGAVYDESYSGRFLREDGATVFSRILRARQAQGKPVPNVSVRGKPDRHALSVDVTIEIKN